MKRIMADFLRRWWGAYLIALPFVGAMAALMGPEESLTFVCIPMLPFAFELGRRPVGVMAALPVSRKTIALSYWCIAVLLPALLMAGTIALAGLHSPSSAISLKSVAVILFGPLVSAGSTYCLFTFIAPDVREGEPGDFLAMSMWAMWFPAAMFGIFRQEFLDITTQSPVAYLWGLLGLLLTVQGYLRSEKLVTGRARKRSNNGERPTLARFQIPALKPGLARFGGVFFGDVWKGFLIGLVCPTVLQVLGSGIGENEFFSAWLFVCGAMGASLLLSGGARLLRSLPLSAGRLALTLLLMPFFSILGVIAGLAINQRLTLGHFLRNDSATLLIPIAGAVGVASSFIIRFGKDGLPIMMILAMPAAVVITETVSNEQWPAAFWWLLGMCLMVAAFFLNRHWLRSSYSYRPSAGRFARR